MSIAGGLLIALGASTAEWAGPLLDKAAERLFVSLNHELEQALRLAELTTTLVLLDIYRRREEAERFDSRATKPPEFIATARRWLHQQLGLSPSIAVIPNEQLVAELNEGLDKLLAIGHRNEVHISLGDVEREVWQNLKVGAAKLGGDGPPAEFEALFFGREEGEPGWSVTFLAFMREVLKKNPRVEIAFVVSRLATVRNTLARVEPKIDILLQDSSVIKDRTERIEEKLNAILGAFGGVKSVPAVVIAAADRALEVSEQHHIYLDVLETAQAIIDRMVAIYLNYEEMNGIIKAAIIAIRNGSEEVNLMHALSTTLLVGERNIKIVAGLTDDKYWAINVYVAEKDPLGNIVLRCCASTTPFPSEDRRTLIWLNGVGVVGVSYENACEIIVADLNADYRFSSRELIQHDDEARCRSVITAPIFTEVDAQPWGVVSIASEDVNHFVETEQPGVWPTEVARALADAISLLVVTINGNKSSATA
jgi:hypothetical protein